MRSCVQCGATVADGDMFCSVCGAKQPTQVDAAQNGIVGDASATAVNTTPTCPQCGAAVSAGMRFCEQCGAPLPDSADVATGASPSSDGPGEATLMDAVPAVAPSELPSYAPFEGFSADTAQPDAFGAVIAPAGHTDRRKWPVIMSILAAVAVLALIGAGTWWFVIRPKTGGPGSAVAKSASAQDAGATKAHPETSSASPSKAASCTTPPDAQLASTSHEGDMLVAKLDLDTNCEHPNASFSRSNVRVSIRDADGVVAAAVFDFKNHPVDFRQGRASLRLAYGLSQYWRPFDSIDPSSSEVVFQAGEAGNGAAAQAPADAVGGSNVRDSDIERNAQIALQSQISHDSSAASNLYDQYTTQLSSKKYGLQAEGKTWHYNDIEAQFLQMRLKYPKALLIWAANYSNYTENGNQADYYVVLSGENLASADDGSAWCSSNGYSSQDCIPVQLQ